MADKEIKFGITVENADFSQLIQKLRDLEQIVGRVATAFGSIGMSGVGTTGSTSSTAGGVAVPTTGGAAGSSYGRKIPLIANTESIKKALDDTIPKLREYIQLHKQAMEEVNRSSTASGNLAEAISGASSRREAAGSGVAPSPIDAGPIRAGTTSGGPAYSSLEVNTVNINAQTVNINGKDIGTGGGGGAGGAGGGGATAGGGGGMGRGVSLAQRVNFASNTIQGFLGGFQDITEAEKRAAFIPLEAYAGKSSLDNYFREKLMAGDLSALNALRRISPEGNLRGLARIYGLKKQSESTLENQRLSGFTSFITGGLKIGTSVASMMFPSGPVAIAGQAVSSGGSGGGGFGGMDGSSGEGLGGSFRQTMSGFAAREIARLSQLAGVSDVEEQKSMIRALEMFQQDPVLRNDQLFQSAKPQIIATQRSLGRANVGGQRAYDLANLTAVQYGIETSEAMGLAGMVAHGRSFSPSNIYGLQTSLDAAATMQTAGYQTSSFGGLMNIAGLRDIATSRSYGMQKNVNELDTLNMMRFGDLNVQEAVMSQVMQSGMMGYGGLASDLGISSYASMVGAGAQNAQQVGLRGMGMAGFNQLAQAPLTQAMTLMQFQKMFPQSSVAQQLAIQKLSPAELADPQKLMRIIDPYGPQLPSDAGYAKALKRARTTGEGLLGGIFDTAASQLVEKKTPLGQMLTSKGGFGGAGGFGKLISEIAQNPAMRGYRSEAAMALAPVVGGIEQAQQLMESYAARGQKPTSEPLKEAANRAIVDAQRVSIAQQTEAVYAGFNTALEGLQGTFANAQSEILNIMSQLSNNTASNITTGSMITSTAGQQ
jgi:hypothetical protein